MAYTATYVSTRSFTVVGDKSSEFMVGRRVRCNCGGDGYFYGTIDYVAYNTTTGVSITARSGDLTSSLTEVEYGIVSAGDDTSLPQYPAKINLLTNSGFGVWSNSTVVDVGSDVTVSDISSGVCTSADTEDLVVGKLVRFGPAGFTGTSTFEVTALTADTEFTLNDTSITDASGCTCVEFTPGCVAADTAAPDGWTKDATLDLLRQYQDDAYTKDGSFYALKATKGADTAENLKWLDSTTWASKNHLDKFRGRTVTAGCWVYSTTATAKIRFYYGTGNERSDASSAGSAWEWIETSLAVPSSSATTVTFSFWIELLGSTSDVVYISQPMLVFGNHIGESNYVQPFGETIRFEADVVLTDYDMGAGDIAADVDAEVNIEVQSNGKIPKGVAEIYTNIRCADSGAATNFGVWMGPDTTYTAQDIGDVGVELNGGIGNDEPAQAAGWVRCDSGGDPWLFINQSGSGLLDAEIRVTGVRLR